MSDDFLPERDLLSELIALVNQGEVFSDIHIEQDACIIGGMGTSTPALRGV